MKDKISDEQIPLCIQTIEFEEYNGKNMTTCQGVGALLTFTIGTVYYIEGGAAHHMLLAMVGPFIFDETVENTCIALGDAYDYIANIEFYKYLY